METITENIAEEKQWAVGLDQVEFERQFQIRYPFADVIPCLDDWLGRPVNRYHGITPILPEQMEEDDPAIMPKKQDVPKQKVWTCRGCGKESKVKAAMNKHEMYCKAAKNLRSIEVNG